MSTPSLPLTRAERGEGHIGLIVLGSIASGIALGGVLVFGVFGGGSEATITGAALLSLGWGMLMLFLLAGRRTDQPQAWAFAPAVGLGVAGLALLVLTPGDRALGRLGWFWPLLLALLIAWSVRGARSSLHNWSRRTLLYPAFIVLGLVSVGGAFEKVAEAVSSNPAPSTGRTYVVAGHTLYLRCAGSGSPTVVLFNGLGERTPSWVWVERGVARQTRVCVFDRAGQGWSGEGHGGQDAHRLSADARGLLSAARIPGPYVLAGHSVGGAYALAFAMDFPADVAGVALLDSATPYQFDLPSYPGFYSMWRRVSAALPTLARAGLPRMLQGMGSASLPSEFRANNVEFAELPTVFRQTKGLRNLYGKPLYVLTADVGQMTGWFAAQNKLAKLSTNTVHRTTRGATHAALLEDEHFAALGSRAIDAVVRAVRTGAPLGS